MSYKRTYRPNGRPRKLAPVAGKRPKLSAKAWAALEFAFDNPTATKVEIARAAGVSRGQLYQWLNDPHFIQGQESLAIKANTARVTNVILERLAAGDRQRAEQKAKLDKNERYQALRIHMTEREKMGLWRATMSPVDGKEYKKSYDYRQSIKSDESVRWVGDLDEYQPTKK